MHYYLFFLRLIILTIGVSLGPTTHASPELEKIIISADKHFDSRNYQQALKKYQEALQLAQQSDEKRLEAEVLNNIASVYMETRAYNQFRDYFGWAKQLKQGLAKGNKATTVTKTPSPNLLTNGGFENGLVHPWGTGHYERSDGGFKFGLWWNSGGAKAYMKIDTAEKYAGRQSLRITNFSPAKPHVFTTLSQRISLLKPNAVYRISFLVKTQDLTPGAVTFTVDAAWTKRLLTLSPGTYDWKRYSGTINIGHNNFIDFRIIHQNTGTIWLDDIVIQKAEKYEDTDLLQKAESLLDRAEYAQALKLYQSIEAKHPRNKGVLLATRRNKGKIYLALGEFDKALGQFNWLIDNGFGHANIDAGDLYQRMGDHEKATDFYNKALKVAKGDQGTYSLVLSKLANSYLQQGKLDDSLRMQMGSLVTLRHIDDRHGQAQAYNVLGTIYTQKKQYKQALQSYLTAQQLVEQIDNKRLYSDILNNQAYTNLLAGHPGRATSDVKQAKQLKMDINDTIGLIQSLHIQGRILVSKGEPLNALSVYREAVGILEELYAGLGGVSRQVKATFLGQFHDLYREYIDILFELYQANGLSAYSAEAFKAAERVRSRMFTEMITEVRAARAFASNTNDRRFAMLLRQERQALQKRQSITRRRDRFFALPEAEQKIKERQEIEDELRAAGNNLQTIRLRLIKEYPRYADLKTPKKIGIEAAQRLLNADEAVLSFFITKRHTGIWALTREGAHLAVLPLGRHAILDQTASLRNASNAVLELLDRLRPDMELDQIKKAFASYDPNGAYTLYQLLVKPHSRFIGKKRTVFLVPDDILYKLPFEALLTNRFDRPRRAGEEKVVSSALKDAPFWIRYHDIAYLPSLSVLRSLRTLAKKKKATQQPLIAFADPVFQKTETESAQLVSQGLVLQGLRSSGAIRGGLERLPETREEARYIGQLLGAREKDLYLGIKASETNVKTLPLYDFKTLLFATHGLMAGEFRPGLQPALALSFVGDPNNDGLLELGEILGLDLNADLAVLSACNTASGSGKNDRGEGFAGLTRSFMFAGARSLFVTQWYVESSSAKTLMQSTFKQIKTANKATALAEGKRAMIGQASRLRLIGDFFVSTAHPFFWAPYILVGEAK